MRIQFASDLHLERTDPYHEPRMPVFAGSDLLLLAGDIDRIRKVFCRFSDWPSPVLYVRGNHDSYFDGYESGISAAAKLSSTGTVKLLERSEMVLAGVRVLGCCLWTDFNLMGRVEDAMLLAQYFDPDYRYLRRVDGKLITPEDTRRNTTSPLTGCHERWSGLSAEARWW
ncbi:metallophosphoesterase family protein [Paraburkholderia strydomiana]|uniref:metallophosphoesterase family protein n=1 Tax=Paraburkholderia strydomiana TaxID=1245417 RepID=UPI0038BABA76